MERNPFIHPTCDYSKRDGNNEDCWHGSSPSWETYNIAGSKDFIDKVLKYSQSYPKVGDVPNCYEIRLPTDENGGFTAQSYINDKIINGPHKLVLGKCKDKEENRYDLFESSEYLDTSKIPLARVAGLSKVIPYSVFRDRTTIDGKTINPYSLNGECNLITSNTYNDVSDSEILCNSSVDNQRHNCYWDKTSSECMASGKKSDFSKATCKDTICNGKGNCKDGYKDNEMSDITCTGCDCSSGDFCELPYRDGKSVKLNDGTCAQPTCVEGKKGTCEELHTCWNNSRNNLNNLLLPNTAQLADEIAGNWECVVGEPQPIDFLSWDSIVANATNTLATDALDVKGAVDLAKEIRAPRDVSNAFDIITNPVTLQALSWMNKIGNIF
jgi:hypothetical protein